jgi:thiosulfate dehydrogenase [quinone] large subunit
VNGKQLKVGGILESATGPLAGIFKAMAASDGLLTAVNILNTWGLLLIGLGLFVGLFTRIAQVAGIALLLAYYLSHPPILTEPGFFREGSYFFISKDFMEMMALLVLMFVPTGRFLGLDGLLAHWARKPIHRMDHGQPEPQLIQADVKQIRRREVLKPGATLPSWAQWRHGAIRAHPDEQPGGAEPC